MTELETIHDAVVGEYYLIYSMNCYKTVFVVKVLAPHDWCNTNCREFEMVGKYPHKGSIGKKPSGKLFSSHRYHVDIVTGISYTHWQEDTLYKLNDDEVNKHILMEVI